MNARSAGLSILDALKKVASMQSRPPVPWAENSGLPWKLADFSASFLEHEELPLRSGCEEAAFLLNLVREFECGRSEGSRGTRILELGCGGGRTAIPLLKEAGRIEVVGIDLGPVPLRTAKTRAAAGNVDLLLARADMLDLPFPSGCFHLVYSVFGAFLGFDRRRAAVLLAESRRVLVPGGLMVLEFPSQEYFASLDGVKEWWVSDSSFAGCYSQLGLSENHYLPRSRLHVRRDFIVSLEDGCLQVYEQTSSIYDRFEIAAACAAAGLNTIAVYGDWHGGEPAEHSVRLVAVCRSC